MATPDDLERRDTDPTVPARGPESAAVPAVTVDADAPDPLQTTNPELFRLLYPNYGSAEARSDGGICHWPAGSNVGPINWRTVSTSGGDPKDVHEHFDVVDAGADLNDK